MQWAEVFKYLLLVTSNKCYLLDNESSSTLGCGRSYMNLFLSFLISKTIMFTEVSSSYIPLFVRIKEYCAQGQKSVRTLIDSEARWNANSVHGSQKLHTGIIY